MKNTKLFFTLIALSILVSILWINSGFWEIDKENYINKKVLELSAPFDVRINTEFLKSLESAEEVSESTNESSRTSPEGI